MLAALVLASLAALLAAPSAADAAAGSVFLPPALMERARRNAATAPWAREAAARIVAAAEPWRRRTLDELWSLPFGPRITRSWMVWSDGYCPACRKSVPMYNWRIDALQRPWKVQCPHCEALFPTNDFAAYHRSGLDEQGVFDPQRADRSLLVNAAHSDPGDPLRTFGVDDGEGFEQDGHRWRFIGAYLIYGQWKQAVLGGIRALSEAYALTGNRDDARRCLVLLDRVADLYPSFDYATQALVYERRLGSNGYVSVWHDACEETRELAFAYDLVRPAIEGDAELVAFLSRKAAQHRLANAKRTAEQVRRNIEDGILRDAIRNAHKIATNYPRQDYALAVFHAILRDPGSEAEVDAILDRIFTRGTAVDGVTGEKGLTGYSASAVTAVAEVLARFGRVDPGFLRKALARWPRLRELFRFHIDLWHWPDLTPTVGDCGALGQPAGGYAGIRIGRQTSLAPSLGGLLWDAYRATGDPALAQALWSANGNKADGLPYDLCAESPAALQGELRAVIRRRGPAPTLRSVDKQQWRIALLRGGRGDLRRSVWLDYDSGGGHGHLDAMNLGLFAFGRDLMPDLGYPPVQFGGWDSPRARWYIGTASHNTVVVDGQNQPGDLKGATTLWLDGRHVQVVQSAMEPAADPSPPYRGRYERTVAAVDLPGGGFYALDLFRVEGGREHLLTTHAGLAALSTSGLRLTEAAPPALSGEVRSFRRDASPASGWSAEWRLDELAEGQPAGPPVVLRRIDLTEGAEAWTCEKWAVAGLFDSTREVWLPSVLVRRTTGAGALGSVFVGILAPWRGTCEVVSARRLSLRGDGGAALPGLCVGLEVTLTGGARDLLLALDRAAVPAGRAVSAEGVQTDAAFAWVRFGRDGRVQRMALAGGQWLRAGRTELRSPAGASSAER